MTSASDAWRHAEPYNSMLRRAISAGKARVRAGEGVLYVVEYGTPNKIKIGHALNLERRLRELSGNGHVHLRLLGSFPAAITTEQAFHKRFRAHRIDSECYSRDWLMERAA